MKGPKNTSKKMINRVSITLIIRLNLLFIYTATGALIAGHES
jgi:hypothetical protein